MELIWSNDGVSTEEKRENNGISYKGKPLFLGRKIKKERKEKSHTAKEFMKVWEIYYLLEIITCHSNHTQQDTIYFVYFQISNPF